jgi:lipopolysaccharide/colanic/teichoic acid biosynthesis glycosyltransferase
MTEQRPQHISHALLYIDCSMALLAFLATFYLIPWLRDLSSLTWATCITIFCTWAPLWLFMRLVQPIIRSPYAISIRRTMGTISKIHAMTFVFTACLLFVYGVAPDIRTELFTLLMLSNACVCLGRCGMYLRTTLRERGGHVEPYRILLVGSSAHATRFLQTLSATARRRTQIVGIVEEHADRVGTRIEDVPIIGAIDQLQQLLDTYAIDEAILWISREVVLSFEDTLVRCEQAGIITTIHADAVPLRFGYTLPMHAAGYAFRTSTSTAYAPWKLALKRCVDLTGSSIALLLTAPCVLSAMALLRFVVRGAVIARETRCGINGQQFLLYQLAASGWDHSAISRWIYRLGIHQLPQLWNVFRGDMSLVGLRPPCPKDVLNFKPSQQRALSMRPGMICLDHTIAQRRIPSEPAPASLQYIDQWSLWLDLKIIAQATLTACTGGIVSTVRS